MPQNDLNNWLSDPTRLRALTQVIRAKIPAHDVDDIVQSTLADALSAPLPPTEPAAFERWLYGIARHKIADYYRKNRSSSQVDFESIEASAGAESLPESARDLLRWVNQELPERGDANRTLEWMMREASGDKLETIAIEHDLPAPAVRQRVSRLRRFLRDRWALQAAAALGLLAVITGLYAWQKPHPHAPTVSPDMVRYTPTPSEQARLLRNHGLQACEQKQWEFCLRDLDRAKALDPAGDRSNNIQEARAGAALALHPPTPVPAPAPSLAPQPAPTTAPAPPRPPRRTTPNLAPKFPRSDQNSLK